MSGLKQRIMGLQPGMGLKISPDEIDRYEQYTVMNPSIDAQWFGTVAGTQTQNKALVLINPLADYARNVRIAYAGASGSVINLASGSIVYKNQFGVQGTETYAGTPAANGGTIIGTAVMAEVLSGTFTMGTADPGSGTIKVGVGTAGTTTVFGLPTKIFAASDIKRIRGSFNGVGTSTAGTFVFGGTPSSAAATAVHGFKAPLDLAAGTVIYDVLFKTTYDASNETDIANL